MTTTTQSGALDAMLAHHAQLADGVVRRVAAVSTSAQSGEGTAPAAAALVAFIAREVLPHALAEEQTIYKTAADVEGLADVVAAMVEEHRQLAASVDRLATAEDAGTADAEARAIGSLFATHVAKENEVLLPPLAADDAVDLGDLLARMHHLMEASAQEVPNAQDAEGPDTESGLLALVLEAADRLAKAGDGDPACRLAAAAWATLRVPRPDLAVRTTAALHRLVRSVTAAPVTFATNRSAPTGDGDDDGGGGGGDQVLDVRTLAPAQRHEQIFASYDALAPGHGFVLVNDHDPKPLRYQFEAEHAGEFSWDVLQAGPTVWRVRIVRPGGEPDGAADRIVEGEPELDVRVLPHARRHHVIFTAYDALGPGDGFVLVNDHDPKPLRYQFEAEHAGHFTWDYLEAGPRTWRVRIGRSHGGAAR